MRIYLEHTDLVNQYCSAYIQDINTKDLMIELAPKDLWIEKVTQDEALMYTFFRTDYRLPTWAELPQVRQLLNKEVFLIWTQETIHDPNFELFKVDGLQEFKFTADIILVKTICLKQHQ